MSSSDSNVPDSAPPVAMEARFAKARQAFFESYGSAHIERNRWFVGFTIVGVWAVSMTIAVIVMLPLKESIPYVIQVESSGKVTGDPVKVQKWEADDKVKRYFLTTWVQKLLTVDVGLSLTYLKEAHSVTRGKAQAEFLDFIKTTKPLGKLSEDGTFNQQASVLSVSFVSESVAVIRVALKTRSNREQEEKTEKKVVTLHFAFDPPKEIEQIQANPIGLFITHFQIDKDLDK